MIKKLALICAVLAINFSLVRAGDPVGVPGEKLLTAQLGLPSVVITGMAPNQIARINVLIDNSSTEEIHSVRRNPYSGFLFWFKNGDKWELSPESLNVAVEGSAAPQDISAGKSISIKFEISASVLAEAISSHQVCVGLEIWDKDPKDRRVLLSPAI